MKMEKAAAVFLGFSLFAASSGLTSAYLKTEPKMLKNVVTTGSVNVKLTEPAWKPEEAQNLTPGDRVSKNPTVTNTGKNDAWLFLRVSVPVKHISVVDPDSKRKKTAADVELFSFTADASWELLERKVTKSSVDYVYGYKKLVSPQASARPLFENVTLINYLEGELSAEEVPHIPIHAAAIQDHVCPPGAQLSEIYKIYLSEETVS